MSERVSKGRALFLGLMVVMVVGSAAFGLIQIGARQGLWQKQVEFWIGFPEVHEVQIGTPVRIKGVHVGQVVSIDYPDHDGTDANVTVRVTIDAQFADRIYNNSSASIRPTGLLGGQVIAIDPGLPRAGPLLSGQIPAKASENLTQAVTRLNGVADQAELLLKEARSGNGTLGKLIRDDSLHKDLQGLTSDAREVVQKVDAQTNDVKRFVQDSRETLRVTQRTIESANDSWIGRRFLKDDEVALLVRPTNRRSALTYNVIDLFEPDSAILTTTGHDHLAVAADWIKQSTNSSAEVVVMAMSDPSNNRISSASASMLTRKQAESVVDYLRSQNSHKRGWWTRRTITPLGIGMGPNPIIEKEPMPLAYVQIILFEPVQ